MPKAELHLHIEGTLEPELKFELAARNGLALPYASVDEMRAAYDFNSLASFLTIYYEGMNVLVTEQDFYDLAMAYFRKAHSQNVVYAEIFFDPQGHTSRGIAFETVVKGFRRAQENSVGHIWQCLDEIKVERIDHGVNALEDPALIKEINKRGLGLTVCPISNGFVTDGLKAQELKLLLDGGVRATINSDDPAYFAGYMSENFVAVQGAVRLNKDEVVQLSRNAFNVTWLPQEERDAYVDALDAYAAKAD